MALILLAANNAQTVLSAGISSSATTLTVNTGTGALFPAPVSGTSFYKLTLVDAATGQLTEIMHVTARTGDVMTVLRAQEGTTARAWSANDIVANMLTSGTLAFFAQLESPTFTGAPKAPTAPNGTSTTQLATTAFVLNTLAANPGRLINIKLFLTSGTYTPTTGTKIIRVKAVGAGGGGGGAVANTTSGNISAAYGGSSGSYGETSLIDATSISTVTVTVGAAGAASSGVAGTTGGSTSFGAYLTAPGGAGGTSGSSNSYTAPILGADLAVSGACSGSSMTISIQGDGGKAGFILGNTQANQLKGGSGGSSMIGIGGSGVNAGSAPNIGTGWGAGGAGAVAAYVAGTSAVSGSYGKGGLVIVEEYA
ncbi:TPA: hypothetical protein QCJ76_002537 [Enterobacter asburiae]|nr:hypothetical protein [Enterobacter asburiae]